MARRSSAPRSRSSSQSRRKNTACSAQQWGRLVGLDGSSSTVSRSLPRSIRAPLRHEESRHGFIGARGRMTRTSRTPAGLSSRRGCVVGRVAWLRCPRAWPGSLGALARARRTAPFTSLAPRRVACSAAEAMGRLPSFVVIGAMRCGTTSMHAYLRERRDLHEPGEGARLLLARRSPPSELARTRGVSRAGPRAVRRRFRDAGDARAVGETSASYPSARGAPGGCSR